MYYVVFRKWIECQGYSYSEDIEELKTFKNAAEYWNEFGGAEDRNSYFDDCDGINVEIQAKDGTVVDEFFAVTEEV